MSESTSAPVAPAAPPPAPSPAPSSQPAISVSDAARIMRQQRQASGNGEAPAVPPVPARTPSVSEQLRQAAQRPPDGAQAAPAPPRADAGLSAMERALGVPGVAPPEGTPPLQQTVTPPTIDGTFVEIEGQHYTQPQLREYVLKAQDYTKKTQELATQRQQLAAQQQALAEVIPLIRPELDRLAQSLQRAEQVHAPDPSLALTDPTQYVQLKAQYDASMAEQQRLGQLTYVQQQAQERALAQAVAQANQILAQEYPFWNDPAQRLEAQNQIVDWATSKGGYTRDELKGLADPRILRMMMKSRAYDHWTEGARSTAPIQQLAAPPRGVPPPTPPTARVQEAQARFEAKPDWRSGAALLGAMRANNGR